MKVAFSHDWLNGMRGGEKCLEALCEVYPGSPIYALFYEKGKVSEAIAAHPIRVSWIQKLPKVFEHYRRYLPFFPRAVESFKLKDADVVISLNHCVAKGIRKPKGAFHVCYCFTPMRYAWGFFDEYFGDAGLLTKNLIRFFIKRLRDWDLRSSNGVDHFVAISHHIKNRIRDFYRRDADVVYPPADTEFFTPEPAAAVEDYYLMVSALVPYKRVDMAVNAFNKLGRRLLIVGDGPEKKKLEKRAKSNIEFMGWLPNEDIREYYRRARALVFPGQEDFGIVPVEIQACGRFVIAYAKGGALETVIDGKTGVFFMEPTEKSLSNAVEAFEGMSLDSSVARQNALRFSKQRFQMEMQQLLQRCLLSRAAK